MRYLTISLLNVNEAQLTINVLDKLAALPAQNWAVQLILVDNGSRPDQLQELLTWFSSHKDDFTEMLWVTASRNLGVNGGRNLAFKLAAHDRVLILDNDLNLPETSVWLETLWQRLEDDPTIAIVAPMLVFDHDPGLVQSAGIGLTATGRVGYLHRAAAVDQIPPTVNPVVAAPAACWLLRREAQQAVGLLSAEFYPMQYEDVDFCVRLGQAGWKIVCDAGVHIRHIENVTTRHLAGDQFARLTVRQGMKFKEKWAAVLPQIATITEADIYWGPIPRADE